MLVYVARLRRSAIVIKSSNGNDGIDKKFWQFRRCRGSIKGAIIQAMNDETRLQQVGKGFGLGGNGKMGTQFTQFQPYTAGIKEILDFLIGGIVNTYLIGKILQV